MKNLELNEKFANLKIYCRTGLNCAFQFSKSNVLKKKFNKNN